MAVGPTLATSPNVSTVQTVAQGDNPTSLDSESAALFRAWLRPLFDQAVSWPALIKTLEAKGYGLAIREGRLVLTDKAQDAPVCTARFLGTSLRELAQRMGRPCVQARGDASAAGEFLV